MLASLFTHPMLVPSHWLPWMMLPLCASVAVIYKTVRVPTLRRLPRAVVVLWAYMLGGLIALAAALWLICDYWL